MTNHYVIFEMETGIIQEIRFFNYFAHSE